MNSDINYVLLICLIVIVTISIIYSSKKKRKTLEFLKLLEFDYPSRIKINGRVKFSKFHILIDVGLNIIYSKNELLIYGYDYYRNKKTHFIFFTDERLKKDKENRIPNYLITKIDIIENNKIVIIAENNCEITLLFESYGKEKKQLKEESFLELLNKLFMMHEV